MGCDADQKSFCLSILETFRQIARDSRANIDSDDDMDIVFNGLMILFRTVDLTAGKPLDEEEHTQGCSIHLRMQTATVISTILEAVDRVAASRTPQAPISRRIH